MIEKSVDLKSYNTFGISVLCNEFATFSSHDEISEILAQKESKELLILGGGSNVLFTKNFQGIVLKNEIKGVSLISETENEVIVQCGAGEQWHSFVLRMIEKNYAGIENLSLIPGSVGASPMQNIGAYGVEIKDVFHSLEAFHIPTGEIHTFDAKDCAFGYRESVFKRALKNQYIITSVSFKLAKNGKVNTSYGAIESELAKINVSNPTIRDISNAVIAIRSSKLPDPKKLGNAGSFFKNPVIQKTQLEKVLSIYPDAPNYPAGNEHVKIAAGWLIEKSGWKGKTIGTCGVHSLQALVLVNYGGSTGQEVLHLSTQIIQDVKNNFGIELEREVNII
jgi:UDP-N-acetylmuramate dehydrogenase